MVAVSCPFVGVRLMFECRCVFLSSLLFDLSLSGEEENRDGVDRPVPSLLGSSVLCASWNHHSHPHPVLSRASHRSFLWTCLSLCITD